MDKQVVEKELAKLIDIRTDFLNYLDESIPKKENKIEFDFSENPTIDSKMVYEHFFKLDYQARKLRGFLVNEFGLKA